VEILHVFDSGDQRLMGRRLADAVAAILPRHHRNAELARFYELVRNYPERGGKRLRGRLLLLSAAAHGGDWLGCLKVAAALELFHNWALIHDDIEDGSELRRGAPALHRLSSIPAAINAGDSLHAYMWGALLAFDPLADEQRRLVLEEFEWMIQRTIEGQHLDIAWVQQGRFDISEDDYIGMVTLKTAYYTVACPLRLGAFCADVNPDRRLLEAGTALGVAFQIRDDVLNLMPEVSYGKEFAGDLYEGKRTLVLAHLFARASAEERAELEELLGRPRELMTGEDIERILTLIGRYHSLRYAQEVAEARARQGFEQLAAVLDDLPCRAAVAELMTVLGPLASRHT
jgi:geranylgeranyl diphosphate synthase type II